MHILIDTKDYFANMVNGKATVPITDLTLGRYLATTSFESDSYTVDTFNSYIDIKSSIDANNLTKIKIVQQNSKQHSMTLTAMY